MRIVTLPLKWMNSLISNLYLGFLISFSHNTTGLILSRISYFSSGYGPYAQLNSYYRGVFEEVNVGNRYALDTTYWDEDINDSITGNLEFINENPFFDKFYCSSDLHLKYKANHWSEVQKTQSIFN